MDTCWIKVCGAERISPPPYERALPFRPGPRRGRTGAGLWGTDFPHPNLNHVAEEADLVDLVPRIAAAEREQRLLLVDNPARLYQF
jgi:predicted TIM-barrel fold metal-dependent hydrolase